MKSTSGLPIKIILKEALRRFLSRLSLKRLGPEEWSQHQSNTVGITLDTPIDSSFSPRLGHLNLEKLIIWAHKTKQVSELVKAIFAG